MRTYIIAVLVLIIGLISPVCATGPEPVSLFKASPVSGENPLKVQFTDLSEGNPVTWSWDFGDGATSTVQNPEHIYMDEGFFDVTLITTNAYGKSTGKKVKYIRAGIEPTASFTAGPVSGTPPLTVAFTDLSSESPTSWEWDFGDGTTSVLQNPVHEYTASGTYDVSLIVESAVGTSYIIRDNYIAVGLAPVAEIGASPGSGDIPLEVTFTDLSANNPDTWLWSFGDGYTSTEENPVHTYSRAGEYEVALTAENSFGSDRKVLGTKITAVEPGSPTPVPTSGPVNPPGPSIEPPVANFSASPLTGDAPLTVAFTDRSKGGVTEWRWNFGDGKMSYVSFPTHTYYYPGVYDVTLVIKNDDSGDSLTKTAYINVAGSAPVNPDPTETDGPSPYVPTATATVTPGGSDPDNPYGSDSSVSGSGGGNPADKSGNSTSGNPDGDDGSVWFWVPVFGFIFVILIAVVLYMWMQMYGGGGRDTL